ncbi:unnamed protein product [Mycena citricolor]|uniref:Amidase domain-containing protein n=1 Tax=Mycena citricolor TaxID=2018698 RepID=A0AAD2GTB0_9AGAR|nr:unnamed protein product [Mycena citricolor]
MLLVIKSLHGLLQSSSMAVLDDVRTTADHLSFAVPAEHEADYLALLSATDIAAQAVLSQPDYQPVPELSAYPRTDVHRPDPEANRYRAWAWKVSIDGKRGGVLDGKTVCLKDTICVADVPQLFGSNAISRGFRPISDATVVTRVLDQGGLIVGKAMCENFSHGPCSHSTPFGPVENPYAAGFSAGGSSSGCGALIGSGEVDMGIGGDQGGSIRIPAAHCGLVGLKPSFGLVPYTGVLSSEPTVDAIGPMARTALDAARLLEAIAGSDAIDDRQLGAPSRSEVMPYAQSVLDSRKVGIQGLRIGVLKEGFASSHLHSGVNQRCRAAIHHLAEMGAIVEDVSVPL